MRILLINPPRFNGHAVVREMRCANLATVSIFPPIELAYLAGVLRQYAEVKILDANALDRNFKDIETEIRQFKPQAVIFTISPTTFTADAQIAKIAKEADDQIKTILLDSHISPAMPERVRQNFPKIDYLVSREPLLEIPGLLGFPGIAEIENHPLPAYDLLPVKKYFSLSFTRKKPFASLITSVGCPNRCNFCIIGGATVDRGYGKIWKFKSASKILEEIKHLLNLGIRSIYFFDETFTADRERVKSLCKMIIEKGLKFEWSCNGRADTLDEETIKMMKKAGCWNVMFGIECGSEGLLKEANKGTTLTKAMEAVDFCQKNGIKVTASFMLGMPEESMETVKQTLDAAKKINPHRAQFVILTPYPGTKLYDEIKEKGLLVEDYSFSGYDGYCAGQMPALRTEYLTSRELVLAQKYIYRKFYLRPSLWLRTILSIRNFGQLMDILRFVKYLK
ncbi:MAG: radical SAM protein [Candidatus Nealsonbacteria bacterium]|nr:radical SAM protein [Candidatus Nealsonbacteria bacterium]